LKKFDLPKELEKGVNKHFNNIKSYFADLVEVKFVGNCNYLLLEYIESNLSKKELLGL
jgi:hypothetical protein